MYNGRAALSCSMNLFPTENYFTAATKRVISSMQSFTKKISGRKGKDSAEIFPSSECWWTLQLKFDPALNAKLSRCMQIFRSNWRGLAPLGPSARPDKFINLASRGIIILRLNQSHSEMSSEVVKRWTIALGFNVLVNSWMRACAMNEL